MKIGGMSDLARLQVLKGRAVDTRAFLDKAARELTTNQKASRYEATGGNLTRLFALERSIDRNAVFSENVSLTELRLDVMQESLGRILTPVEALAVDLTTSVNLGDRSAAEIHAAAARGTFEVAVGALNKAVAGQSLFAGTGTDGAALAPAAAILADLDALTAAAPDAAGVIAAVEGYFEKGPPPGAFYTTGYIGSVDDMSAVEVGEGQRLDYALRADSDEVVAVLEALALAAVVDGGALAGVPGDRMTVLGESGARLLARTEGLMAVSYTHLTLPPMQ